MKLFFNQNHPNTQKRIKKILTASNKTLFQSSYQTTLKLSGSYQQKRVNTFSEFISIITDTFWELHLNNITQFSRHQTILTFSDSYLQTILHTFLEFTSNNADIFREFTYLQTILQIFQDFISLSNNTGIFREILANNTTRFFRVYIMQY